MKRAPLFEGPPQLLIEASRGLPFNPSCFQCHQHAASNKHPTPIQAELAGGTSGQSILIVGGCPTRDDETRGRPFTSQGGTLIRKLCAQHAPDKPVIFDFAVRCAVPEVKDKHISACRGYLRQTILEAQPSRIIALGSAAAEALTGRSVNCYATPRGFSWLTSPDLTQPLGLPVPVFFMPWPAREFMNRFLRQRFEANFVWAMSHCPPEPDWNASAWVVENAQDAKAAVERLRSSECPVSFDVETAGAMYSRSFRMVSCALAASDSEVVVWDARALQTAEITQPLLAYMADAKAKKSGQNAKFDLQAFYSAYGVMPKGLAFDTRLAVKMMEVESSAKLADMAERIGYGGHKEEARDAMAAAVKRVGKLKGNSDSVTLEELGQRLPDLDAHILNPDNDTESWAYAFMPPKVLTRYNARDAVTAHILTKQLSDRLAAEPDIERVWQRLQCPAASAIAWVEAWGIGVDKDSVRAFDAFMELKELAAKEKLDASAPGVNWNSPDQVAHLLFDELKLVSKKKTKGGGRSTDADVLEALAGKHPVPSALLEYRGATKMRSTYASGLLHYIRDDGRVHPSFNLDGARSGRASSSDPNFQNIPTALDPAGQMIRNCIVAALGWTFIEADFSQIELRLAAALSGDPDMCQIFLDKVDYHLRTAQLISKEAWGITPEQVGDEHRRAAKGFNFGILYGMGDKELARKLGITVAQAASIRAAIMGKFKKLDAFCKNCLEHGRKHGEAWTWWDGHRARRRDLWRIAEPDTFVASTAEHGSWNCLDEETEALTERGWVRGFDLKLDDVLLTKNPSTGELEWQGMTDLKQWKEYEGPLVEFESRSFSAVTTPAHRWLVRGKDGKDLEKTTATLSKHGDHRIHRTGMYVKASGLESDDLAELAGWYLTDGSEGKCYRDSITAHGRTYAPRRGSITIYQSLRAKPQNVRRIDDLLARMGLSASRSISKRDALVQWTVRGPVAETLQALLPRKCLNWKFLLSLSAVQAKRLMESLMLGDGTSDGKKEVFYAKDKASAEAFQALATLCGVATTAHSRDMSKYAPISSKLRGVPKMGTIWAVTLLRRSTVQVTESQRREFHSKQGVWCPVVPNTFFVARRKGTVYVTGNTPVQGSASDFLLASLVSLVEWVLADAVPAKVVLPIHDSIMLEVRDQNLEEVAWQMQHTMEGWNSNGVPMVVDFKIGKTWGAMQKWHPGEPIPSLLSASAGGC